MSPSYDEVERAIAAVPGVADASVGASETGGTRGKLRIRLSPGHDADVVAVAIAAELRTRFGIDIDPATIRPRAEDERPDDVPPRGQDAPAEDAPADRAPAEAPAEEAPAEDAAPPAVRTDGRRADRPIIQDLIVGTEGLEVQVEVQLDLEGRGVRGVARAAATRRATLRAIARATLDAVEALAPGRMKTEIDAIELFEDGEEARVTVTLTLLTEHGAERLIGVAMGRGDTHRATVRATLDACNRRVGLLLVNGDGSASSA